MNKLKVMLCLMSISLLISKATGQELYQKSWLVDVSAGTPLLEKGGTMSIQARISGGYEMQFTESGILGLAIRGGYALSRGSGKDIEESGIFYETDNLIYKYSGNTLFVGVSPMIIFEHFDSNFDRFFIESEFGLASHNVDMNIYQPLQTATTTTSSVHFKGYIALRAGFRLAWKQEGHFRAMSIWGSLHNQSPINAIEKTIPENWPYKFKEDLKSQWQIGVSYYI
ncbi:MAG TPA: hypothetical protein PKU86_07755 [Bacteroidales bacterium]|nr:hypothetical protein [Bacteroidales bacterium]